MTASTTVPSPRRRASYLVLRGGGFSLVRVTPGNPKAVHEVCAGSFDSESAFSVETQLNALRAALAEKRFRNERVTVVLGEIWSRTHLMAVPDTSLELGRKVLQNQLGSGEVFCSTRVGSIREGNATLDAHIAITASERDLVALVRALRDVSIKVEGFVALDGSLMQWGSGFLSEPTTGLRMVLIVEPAWLHIACYDAGKAVFIRRVETLPDLPEDARATAALTEIQRTVLVVRGRLKTPELEGVIVIDPMSLIDQQAADATAAPLGIGLRFVGADLRVLGATSPTAAGDAIRAASTHALSPRTRRDITIPCDALKDGARRARVAASIAFMVLCLAGAALFEKHRRQASLGSTSESTIIDESRRELVDLVEDARGKISTFDGMYRGLASYVESRPPLRAVLDRIGPALSRDIVVDKLVVDRVAGPLEAATGFLKVRIEGLARGPLDECRPTVRALHESIGRIPGVSALAEEAADLGSLGSEPVRRDRSLTRFVFSFQLDLDS